MGEKQNKFILNKAQEELHRKIASAVKLSMKQSKINMSEMHWISDVSPSSLTGFLSKNKSIGSYSLVKIMEVLGFELTISKRADSVNPKEDPAILERIKEAKEKQKLYARNKRGYKGPKTIRTKRAKTARGALIAHSRQQQLEQHRQSENDFLGSNRRRDAIP